MKMLSIDSSGKTAACAVTEDGILLAQNFTDSGLTHSQTLLAMTDSVLTLAGVDISDIDEFAVTVGPGSFTGLRIGTALVMGLANGRFVRAVPTLKALAYNLRNENCIIIPVLDARRNQVYTAVFESKNGVITRLYEDSAMSVEDVMTRIAEYENRPVKILGDGAYLFGDAAEVYTNVTFPEGKNLYVGGESIALAAADETPVPARDLKLSYLRMSQAERELKEKQKND